MSGVRAGWLVALRELRERSQSKAFRASLVIMVLVVAAMIVLPSMIESSPKRDVGLTGSAPAALADTITAQARAVGLEARVRRFDSRATAEDAVRDGDIDVLVVDAGRLEWRRHADDQLRAVVTTAIQLVAIEARAADAGIDRAALGAVLAPVEVKSVEIGQVAGRSPDDETAALVMNVVLLMVIATFGNLVLSGVVEEKSSRVVEVLLARISPRALLAGKVTGIGLLGLAQVTAVAMTALIATATVDSVDVPAVRGAVIAWVVIWFVLGYALYAMLFGTVGSLASRTEDAQSVAGPVQVVLIAGYFVSFAAIGSPDAAFARVISFLPPTAPLAMPVRIAMGGTWWWEPIGAALLTIVTIAALAVLGGRVYEAAILHSGPTLKLRDAWRARDDVSSPRPPAVRGTSRPVRYRSTRTPG